MTARSALSVAVALLALSGCGGEDSPSASLNGPLEYVRSGGIAGETQVLSIQPDGRGRVTSDLGGTEQGSDFSLDDSQRDEIAKLVNDVDLRSVDAPETPPVADGYQYELTYGGDTVRWEMDGTPQEIAELVRVLGELAEANRP
jgi:hypothetical protein